MECDRGIVAGEDGFTQIKGGRGRSVGKVRSCRRHETSVSRETSRFLTLPRLVVQGVIHGVDAAGASRRSYDEQGAASHHDGDTEPSG
jgi:hypothetical protein